MFTETRTVRLNPTERAQDFQSKYDAVAKDLHFLEVLKRLCGVTTLDFISSDKLLITVGGSSRVANNHALCAVETAVRHWQPSHAYAMVLCTKKELDRMTNGTRRFKEPDGVTIAMGVPVEPYQRQPIFITSADNALLHTTATQFQRAQQQAAQVPDLSSVQPTKAAPNLRWFGDYEVRSIEDQLKPLLDQLDIYFNLRPVSLEAGGTCFFKQWGLAVYGSAEEGARVRHDVIMTIWTSPDLKCMAEEMALRSGVTVETYLRTVEADLLFPGGELEIVTAARRENSRVTLFIADLVPDIRTITSSGPTPPSHEVSFLTFQNRYWLLEAAQQPLAMEVGDGGAASMMGGGLYGSHDSFN